MTDDQSTFEGMKYGGVVKIKPATTGMGGDKKLARGEAVAFVGRGQVLAVNFRDASGVNVREHVTAADDVQLVPEDVVADTLEELRELTTGQPRLLSPDGESRRAARAVVRARQAAIEAGQAPSDDDALDLADLAAGVLTIAETDLADAIAQVDDHESPSAFYDAITGNVEALAERALALVESVHRRLCAAIETERQEAEQAERDAAAEQAAAAAVASDDVTDSEAAALNRADYDDDGLVSIGDAAEAFAENLDEPPGGDDEQEYPSHLEEAPDTADDEAMKAEGEALERGATPQQRVAVSKQLMAISGTERLVNEWIEWADGHGIPREPANMTFEQARKALIFLGDNENAEAGD